MRRYLMNLLLLLDLAANTFLGGDPQETLSSRFAKAEREGRWFGKAACRFLNLLDPGHCCKALDEQEGDLAVWRW